MSAKEPLVKKKLRYDPGDSKSQVIVIPAEEGEDIDELHKKYDPEDFKQQEIVAEERDEQKQDEDIDEAYKNTDIEHALGDVWYVTGASDNSVEEDLNHIKNQVLGSNRTRLFIKIKEKLKLSSSEKWTWIKPRLSFAPKKDIADWTDDPRIDSIEFRTHALLGYTSPPWEEEPLVGGVYYCFPPLGTRCGEEFFFVQPCYIVMRKGVRTIVRCEADVDKIIPCSSSSSSSSSAKSSKKTSAKKTSTKRTSTKKTATKRTPIEIQTAPLQSGRELVQINNGPGAIGVMGTGCTIVTRVHHARTYTYESDSD